MKKIITAISILALAAFMTACSKNSAQEAKQVVSNFYQANQTTHPTGALSLPELLTFRQFVSVPLFELLKNVSAAEEAYAQDNEEQHPLLVEGNLLTSHPQGATTYRIINCKLDSDKGMCRVELVFSSDASNQSPSKWIDKVILSQDVRGWVVANIVYAGGGGDMRSGDLHSTLIDILGNPAAESLDDTPNDK